MLAKTRSALAWIQVRTKTGRELASGFLGRARERFGLAFLTLWYRHRFLALRVSLALIAIGFVIVFVRDWAAMERLLSGLERSIIPELVIGIGVAITGIIAIAFSLSLFAIQQVAERGTPATVQAYARDPVMAVVYWAFAALATTCFGVALLKEGARYRAVAVAVGLFSLFLSFVLLNLHFKRVVKFSDPRYTISRIVSRGEKQLGMLQRLREHIVRRSKRPSDL